jgi:putative PIN family toxin of toxin-antitoxin system
VARTEDWLLASEATLNELSEVMMRPKFDRLVDLRLRIAFIKLYVTAVQMVPIHRRVAFCRDPKDDLFLEVAINGRADCVVTEDDDMIDMCAIEGIPILTPAAFLDLNGP